MVVEAPVAAADAVAPTVVEDDADALFLPVPLPPPPLVAPASFRLGATAMALVVLVHRVRSLGCFGMGSSFYIVSVFCCHAGCGGALARCLWSYINYQMRDINVEISDAIFLVPRVSRMLCIHRMPRPF